MSYARVLPRDLFNEAKLLACIGRLCMLIHDGVINNLTFEHYDNEFKIEQDTSDGSISVTNIVFFTDNKEIITFYHPLNSKGKWSLENGVGDKVFDDEGDYILT